MECHSTFHWLVVQVVEQLVLVLLLLEVVLLPVVEVQVAEGEVAAAVAVVVSECWP